MSLADKAKQLAAQAQTYAAAHKGTVEKGVQRAQQTVNAKTGGKYQSQLDKMGQRADAYIDNLPESQQPSTDPGSPTTTPDTDTPAHRKP